MSLSRPSSPTPRLRRSYLMTASALGGSRAACAATLLKELNDGVAGSFVEDEPERLLATDPAFFKPFTLVIATQARGAAAGQRRDAEGGRRCGRTAWWRWTRCAATTACPSSSPAPTASPASCASAWRCGRRVGWRPAGPRSRPADAQPPWRSVQEHTVVESKPDNAPDDLRVSRPWPALAAHCACVGASLGGCDAASHRHVPALVLLVQALAQWKEAHGGAAPKAGAERAAFREGLKARSRSLVPTDDDNIKEALAAAHKAWAPEGVPHDTQTLLGDPRRVAATEAPTGAQRAWLRLALPGHAPADPSPPSALPPPLSVHARLLAARRRAARLRRRGGRRGAAAGGARRVGWGGGGRAGFVVTP